MIRHRAGARESSTRVPGELKTSSDDSCEPSVGGRDLHLRREQSLHLSCEVTLRAVNSRGMTSYTGVPLDRTSRISFLIRGCGWP
jgi:hypothetical protein